MDTLEKLMRLKDKKKHREMSDIEKQAKSDALLGAKSEAEKALGGRLKGLKKVTVASDSEEGLEEGLDVAEDVLEKAKEFSPTIEDSPELEDMEDSYGEDLEYASEDDDDEMTEDEIDAEIQALLEKKQRLAKG